MHEFIVMGCIGSMLIAITSMVIYEIQYVVWQHLPNMTIPRRMRILVVMAAVFFGHIACIWVYGGAYYLIINYTEWGTLTGSGIDEGFYDFGFFSCLYYSAITYTSLGLGDVLPTNGLRMLSGVEVLNGLVLIGWTVSFIFLTMEKFWGLRNVQKED